ncbi:hypothetical protein BDZ94DRAFT_1256294 [Collybia nuda]|uniref:Alpha/beta hydrolase fold-3 domain-containing protein n=1 Tax=Collybia nuda TaxID=64659 RepID=A0A9P5Y6B3_9AGAR|nr:hypothetical protein BDZ94DRAFT_1256294 [Collybia nuda]
MKWTFEDIRFGTETTFHSFFDVFFIMPVTTVSSAVHITPVVIKTFINHGKRKARKAKDRSDERDARDDIFFDQAFNIVKAFIEMGTKNTVESLQAFTNTHVPAPYWAVVSPVLIPLSSCNHAADVLIDWFGPEELKRVVGGERWWQVRGLDGVDGEWITEKEYLSPGNRNSEPPWKLNDTDADILRMETLETVMLYVHGGGYFWGSINTHRYQIIRYARKFKGRAFAVNYRKAPQYPWPCPLQDVIAAYLYLIQPPLGSLHKPILPSKIVFAGDSAGGGLCITVLTILRDMGLPMPAGAVLISPWVDLTHSFPSIVQNTSTDIIPQHGFLAKPSTLWPVDPQPQGGSRITPATSNPPPKPGHADTLRPSQGRIIKDTADNRYHHSGGEQVKTQVEMLDGRDTDDLETPNSRHDSNRGAIHGQNLRQSSSKSIIKEGIDDYDVDFWEPKPPKVLMEDPDAVPLELRAQIQLYATTEQLTHPLVSPVLQGSLGNLPPLYILAGNDEVLRDEIIYLAHRAAHPAEYPVRRGVLRDGIRQQENKNKFTTPTKVHLQVFDDMCHVLTVFSFTRSAKYAYRSIAEFVKHVTRHDPEHLKHNPFPELHRPPSEISPQVEVAERHSPFLQSGIRPTSESQSGDDHQISDFDTQMFRRNQANAEEEVKYKYTDAMPAPHCVSERTSDAHDSHQTVAKDIRNIGMIRERVDIHGITRPLESPEKIPALQLQPGQIGIIKEAPTIKWLTGQEEWDKMFKKSAKRVTERRMKCERKAKRIIDNARSQGLVLDRDTSEGNYQQNLLQTLSRVGDDAAGIQDDRRWGPFDLEDETPPPTAIANRHDTPEAIALIKKSIYHTAPITHRTVPKLRTSDAIRAAFDPKDDPSKAPQQSVSEQQVHNHILPIHGLRIWDGIVRYFGKKTSQKAKSGTKQVGEQLGIINLD